jgi:UDP-N-acetyl-D-mannosaminuronic acid transferase (WecB/TagA/CpsF family)
MLRIVFIGFGEEWRHPIMEKEINELNGEFFIGQTSTFKIFSKKIKRCMM